MHRFGGLRRSAFAAVALLSALLAASVGTIGIPARASSSPSQALTRFVQVSRLPGTVIVDWNKELVRILATPGAQPATVHPTRSFAILHAAMYDAVVSITHGSSPYLFDLNAPSGARPDAAAAEAGHDTLLALFPSMQAAIDQQLAAELAAIPDGAGKQQGIKVGHLAATLMLAARAGDGSSVTPPPFPAGNQPGQFRPVPPAFTPAAFTQWPNVTPFVLQAADQFRPAPPPGLTSDAYVQAINEVKNLGQDTSTTRTADQTVVARFWSGPIWIIWNEIAENAALTHHTGLVRTARLFALLDLSLADTTIAFYDAKYHYDFWRPVTAIREADTVANSAIVADPNWSPLIPAAADPSYPGAHSAISAASAAVLSSFFGDHGPVTVSSDVLPGTVRTFDSYSAAATEAGLSRTYAGLHTRLDHEAGVQLGHNVAQFVLGQAKSPDFGLAQSSLSRKLLGPQPAEAR